MIRYHQRFLGMLIFEAAGNIALFYCSTNLIEKTRSGTFTNPTTKLIEKITGQTFINPTIQLALTILIVSLPVVRSLLFGATLFSTEFEAKTYKFVFTQSVKCRKVIDNYIAFFMLYVFSSSAVNAYIIHNIFVKWTKIASITNWSIAGILMHPIGGISFALVIFAGSLFSGGLTRKVISAISLSLVFTSIVLLLIGLASDVQLSLLADKLSPGENKANFIIGFKSANHASEFNRFLSHFLWMATALIFALLLFARMWASSERPNPFNFLRHKSASSQSYASHQESF